MPVLFHCRVIKYHNDIYRWLTEMAVNFARIPIIIFDNGRDNIFEYRNF